MHWARVLRASTRRRKDEPMSLILDALKKSEAERRRGLPPGISTPFSAPRRRSRAPWAAGAGAIVLAAGLAGGWMWIGRSRDQAPPDLAAETSPPAPVSGVVMTPDSGQIALTPATDKMQPLEVVAASDANRAPLMDSIGGAAGANNGGQVSGGGLPTPSRAGLYTPSADPQPQVASEPVAADPVPAPPDLAVAVVPPAAVNVAEPSMPIQTLPAPAPDQVTFNGQAAIESASIPPEIAAQMAAPKPELPQEQILTVHQLSYSMRKDLPKLDLSMHVFSPVAAERFVVLNGKRFQLDSPAPGPDLNLVDIVSDGVVLEFRGQRFLLPRTSY